jgi:hypothetical protein
MYSIIISVILVSLMATMATLGVNYLRSEPLQRTTEAELILSEHVTLSTAIQSYRVSNGVLPEYFNWQRRIAPYQTQPARELPRGLSWQYFPRTGAFQLCLEDPEAYFGNVVPVVALYCGAVAAPVADAGNDREVVSSNPEVIVTLIGAGSFDPNNLPLSFEWEQLEGPPLGGSNGWVAEDLNAENPTFEAPQLAWVDKSMTGGDAPVEFVFSLIVRNAKGLVSQPDTVKITVRPVESCYDPANVGRIGEADWFGNCDRMLIVNTDQLKAVASGDPEIGNTGNETYAIGGPDGNTYTFANSARNIFTGQVESMKWLFIRTSFDQDIGYWDTANVTNMRSMFFSTPFNHDISNWDTSNVETMRGMFAETEFFNQDIGDWDTSKVKNMYGMFGEAFAFNQDIGDWDTSNVTTQPYEPFDGKEVGMKELFWNARAFDQDLSNWCVENLVEPDDFDTNTPPGFKDNIAKQPKWGVNCP